MMLPSSTAGTAAEEPEAEFEAPDECFKVKHSTFPQESLSPAFQAPIITSSSPILVSSSPLLVSSPPPMTTTSHLSPIVTTVPLSFQEQSTDIFKTTNTFPVVIKTEPEQELTLGNSPLPDLTLKQPVTRSKSAKKNVNRRTQTTASFTRNVMTQTCSDEMEPDYELEFAKVN